MTKEIFYIDIDQNDDETIEGRFVVSEHYSNTEQYFDGEPQGELDIYAARSTAQTWKEEVEADIDIEVVIREDGREGRFF